QQLARIDALLAVVEGRGAEAEHGIRRAFAALEEAVGVDAHCGLRVVFPDEMPLPKPAVSCDAIVKMTLERRGEITQVHSAEEAVALEADAQKRIHGPSGDTFASGGDLHADPIVPGFYDGGYRPGGVSIEMPPTLYGQKKDRVEQADLLHNRALAVV